MHSSQNLFDYYAIFDYLSQDQNTNVWLVLQMLFATCDWVNFTWNTPKYNDFQDLQIELSIRENTTIVEK